MKKILFLGLAVTFCSMADLCDDEYEKYKLNWDKDSTLTICKDALKGDPEAQFDLAGIYSQDEKNYEAAFEWTRKSAAQGCSKSQYVLGLMYYNGFGIDTNWFYAFELFEKASKKNLPHAMTSLGFMYQHAQVKPKNVNKAKELYVKAAKLGDPSAFNLLGEMYLKGDGIDIDIEKAATYFVDGINSITKTLLSDDKNTYPCNIYNDSND
ncbi:sel1 repeat family protein [Providencia rettgeri]